MRRPKPDPQNCAFCFESDCFGCDIWNSAYGVEEDSDDDSDQTDGVETPDD